MAADGFETKRLLRPSQPGPPATAPEVEREAWAERFVRWFLAQTGGDPEVEGVPAGHRWRIEYFDCVRNPQAFEEYAVQEIEAYKANGGA